MIIAGTGHRPDKLGGYSKEVSDKLVRTAQDYLGNTKTFVGPVDKVISGGALGWDQALAQAALNESIPLVMALPFPGFEDRWPMSSKTFLHSLMHRASRVVFVCDEGYAGWKMQERNEWMVDHCDTVLALWDGSSGGTGNCIGYAKKVGKPIVNLWREYDTVRSV